MVRVAGISGAKAVRQGNSNLRLLLVEDFVKEPG
jgi:hypothetical protein